MFGSSDAIIRLDMSEYMEKFSVSRLIGAPPGYVGYDDAGQLSERVRQKPYSLVLFDEIEKAHPDIFNILLQVLDEGRLTDSNGRTVDFRNTIIIITSNIGSRDIRDFGRGIGFGSTGEVSPEHQKTLIDKALGKAFTPEFLNRLDETVYFRSLTSKDMGAILETELSALYSRVHEAGFRLTVSSAAKEFLCRQGLRPCLRCKTPQTRHPQIPRRPDRRVHNIRSQSRFHHQGRRSQGRNSPDGRQLRHQATLQEHLCRAKEDTGQRRIPYGHVASGCRPIPPRTCRQAFCFRD